MEERMKERGKLTKERKKEIEERKKPETKG